MSHFVLEDYLISENYKTMCKASWDEELTMVIFGEFNSYVLAKSWRAFPDINNNV